MWGKQRLLNLARERCSEQQGFAIYYSSLDFVFAVCPILFAILRLVSQV